MSDELNWDFVDSEENITKEDIDNAESMGKAPVGKYLCTVESSKPKKRNPDDAPSYFVAGLKHRIDRVIEINGRAATEEDQDRWTGKFIFDDVSLPREDEPEALKNRRIMIAKRAGIISNTSTRIPKNAWRELIIGKQFLIDHIDQTDKKTGKVYRQVAFDGYHVPEDAVKVTKDDLSDI